MFTKAKWTALELFLCACSSTPLGATDAELAHARSQAVVGASVYERDCAVCHGRRGEGLAATPPVMGKGALPIHQIDVSPVREYANEQHRPAESERTMLAGATRGSFRNARDLHEFLTTHMPKIRPTQGPPTPEEYWQVTSYLLVANEADVPAVGVNAANADTVIVKP